MFRLALDYLLINAIEYFLIRLRVVDSLPSAFDTVVKTYHEFVNSLEAHLGT